jgi:hypothetical protein
MPSKSSKNIPTFDNRVHWARFLAEATVNALHNSCGQVLHYRDCKHTHLGHVNV